jgi:hypothetical protein
MTTDAAGETWDAFGGLPDPFVSMTLNGSLLGSTSVKDDTISASWFEAFETSILGGSTFDLFVYDEDATTDDYMFGCRWQPVSAALLRAYINTCDSFSTDPAGLGSTVRFWFEPI